MFTYGIIMYNRYCVKKVHEIKYSDENCKYGILKSRIFSLLTKNFQLSMKIRSKMEN
jgi:hypothetical protein